jgi:hypothetical protein
VQLTAVLILPLAGQLIVAASASAAIVTVALLVCVFGFGVAESVPVTEIVKDPFVE